MSLSAQKSARKGLREGFRLYSDFLPLIYYCFITKRSLRNPQVEHRLRRRQQGPWEGSGTTPNAAWWITNSPSNCSLFYSPITTTILTKISPWRGSETRRWRRAGWQIYFVPCPKKTWFCALRGGISQFINFLIGRQHLPIYSVIYSVWQLQKEYHLADYIHTFSVSEVSSSSSEGSKVPIFLKDTAMTIIRPKRHRCVCFKGHLPRGAPM